MSTEWIIEAWNDEYMQKYSMCENEYENINSENIMKLCFESLKNENKYNKICLSRIYTMEEKILEYNKTNIL
jgi:hypothetical protein